VAQAAQPMVEQRERHRKLGQGRGGAVANAAHEASNVGMHEGQSCMDAGNAYSGYKAG